jgi:hypothetical protein
MKNQFSWLAFLRKIPLELLEGYLTEAGVCESDLGASIPWTTMEYDRENLTQGLAWIRQAIFESELATRIKVAQDFFDVNEMADDYGMAALINSGRFRPEPVDLRPHFELYEGSHAKAFFVLCEWPEIFHAALRYRRVDAIAEHRWVKTGRIEGADLDSSTDAQRRLAEVISRHYRELGRGQGCAVDVEPRDDEVYIFLYPEDYARRRLAFDDQHHLIAETTRPAFEVIFVWNTTLQTLEYFSPGNQLERQEVLTLFGRVMLGVELCTASRRPAIFHLDPLTSRHFDFKLRPEDGVEAILLKEIWLRKQHDLDDNFYHYGSKLVTDPHGCYQAMDDGLRQERLPLAQMEVYQVQLRVRFRGTQRTARPVTRTITLSLPDMCSLKRNDPYYLIVMQVLRRCGIDRSAVVTEPIRTQVVA